MVFYQKMYLEANINDQYIWHKNSIAQLYFMLRTAKLRWNCSSILKDAFDIHRFSKRKWVLTMSTTENL